MGTFDGQMHTISGLYFMNSLNTQERESVGFIASMGYLEEEPATVKNVGIVGSYFKSGARYVSAVVGNVFAYTETAIWGITIPLYAEVRNTYSTSTVYSTNENGYAAGLVGGLSSYSYLLVENSYNVGGVDAKYGAAGLVGYADDKRVRVVNSYNVGNVYGEMRNRLVLNTCYGCEYDGSSIINSYYLYIKSYGKSNGEIGGYAVDEEEFADEK